MSTEQSNDEITIIRTLECDLCKRFDSILLPQSEVIHLTNQNNLNIGSHIINHNDHIRIVYFDEFGSYLGDTISLSVVQKPLHDIGSVIPTFGVISQQTKINKVRKKMLGLLVSKSINLTIVGPSLAGKTSLALFLETGIPERHTKRVNHSPTMGKSVRRLKLGRSDLTIFDMGGQRDFWDSWLNEVETSKKIIYVFDGTANNESEVIDSLKLVLDHKETEAEVLILVNKLDLIIDGYTSHFMQINSMIDQISSDLNNIWMLKSSVYNGTAYLTEDDEEKNLAEVISDFLLR